MKDYIKIYLDHFNFTEGDFIPCEVTGVRAVDISHNDPRGMGGSKHKNYIGNLMALSREAHTFLEKNPTYYWWFQLIHYHYMVTKVPYNDTVLSLKDPIFEQIKAKLV